jgi:hypothetical protein
MAPAMAAANGSLFHQGGKIWANGYRSTTLEASRGWESGMELCCHIHDPQQKDFRRSGRRKTRI